MTRLGLIMAGLAGCAVRVAEVEATLPTPGGRPASASAWHQLVDEPGPLVVETYVSAEWEVPLHGLLDLSHPEAASLQDGPHPIVLPVTVLRHPERGVLAVDTGIDRELAAGRKGAARGLVRSYLSKLRPVEPLAAVLARQPAPLSGVLLTHAHLDHLLGLPDVPSGVPVYAGPGELQRRDLMAALLKPTYRQLLDGVTLSVLDPARSVELDALRGWDLLGDGSLWALSTPGHTPGALSFLARTPEGPVLMVGDSSHTRWGWEHGVPPGTYTEDAEANARSFSLLKELAAAHPGMRVIVGHELENARGL